MNGMPLAALSYRNSNDLVNLHGYAEYGETMAPPAIDSILTHFVRQ